MTRDAILDILELIVIEFDGFELDAKMADLWEELMSDIPDDLGIAATKLVILNATFRPRVADIRKAALSMLNPESEIDAGRAWELVLKAIHTFGAYQSERALASLPPTVASAAKRVGWGGLCSDEEMISRAHFLKVFESMQDREKQIGVLPPALQSHFRQAALESGPVSMSQLLAPPEKVALSSASASASGRVSGYTPPQNVVPFRRKPQARTPEELRQQAELLKSETTKTAEQAEFSAMSTEERTEYLKQQARQLGGAA